MAADIRNATLKACIEFQEAAAASAAEARLFPDRDAYAPRVIHHQRCAADCASEAMMRLDRLTGAAWSP